jgi:hypothetical protein
MRVNRTLRIAQNGTWHGATIDGTFSFASPCELIVTLFIACAVALLTAKTTPAYSVFIATPRFSFVPSAARLHAICSPSSLACTAIRSTTFRATCEETDRGWHARIDASFVPYTYLWLDHLLGKQFKVLLGHEREHLRDIQSDAAAYVRTLSLQTFHSHTDCQAFAEQKSPLFYERLRQSAQRSQRNRQ